MSRVIKFRVWDTRYKQWTYPSKPNRMPSMWLGHNGEFQYSSLSSVSSETAIIEQFTGLKDSKGIEIYEGDILKCDGAPMGRGVEGYHTVYASVVHDSETGGFRASRGIYGQRDSSPRHFWRYYIVGNIHENNDLL